LASNLDKSLDDILAAKPRRGRGGRRGGFRRGGVQARVNKPVVAPTAAVSNAPSSSKQKGKATAVSLDPFSGESTKIIVSGLPDDVTESQIKVCFLLWYRERVPLFFP